jgi:glycosyltransferase involved in cell wall biosynthesis
MITIFTPSFADEADTNAQNLSVKEIVARLDPQRVHVTILHESAVDPRIAARPNTTLLPWRQHGNTLRILLQTLKKVPDLYFFPREGPLDASFLLLRRMLALKTAVVSYVVSGGLDSAPYSAARERHIRSADAVFANSRHLAHLVDQKMGVPVSGVIYDGADRRYFFPPEPRRGRPETPTVLYAGSFRPYKRAPFVVREAARLPNIKFRLAGTGEEEQTCKNLAAELGCKNVEFLGHLSAARLGDEMRRAHIFFFPSVLEGHPQVLLQAAACGLPSIAMKSYHPDYVVDGATGFLAASDDELSPRLDLLVQNSEMRIRMGEAAASHSHKFEWDAIAQQWQHAFEQVVAVRRQRRAANLQPSQS